MEKFSWKGHGAMLLANTSWGLMSPLAKVVMAGGVITPFVLTDLRIFGAMVLFWAVSLFQKPEHVPPRDMLRLFVASCHSVQSGQFHLWGQTVVACRRVDNHHEYAFVGNASCRRIPS